MLFSKRHLQQYLRFQKTAAPLKCALIPNLGTFKPLVSGNFLTLVNNFLTTVDAFIGKYAEKARKKEKQTGNEIVETIDSFEGEVDGVELAEYIEATIKAHVKISPADCYSAITLWVLLTYVYERFPVCPMLLIVSPTKRCGKTTLIETLEGLVNRALVVSNISSAAAFRTIEKYRPTLLADEGDASMKGNEDLRGIFNAGHTQRNAYVVRAGDKSNGFDPVRFNVFCPKAIASIRRLPDTWEDRGIKIMMQRKAVEDRVKPLGLDFFDRNRELRQKLLTWAAQTAETLDPNVETPHIANDRAKDNWRPLLAIAKALGTEWLQKAQQAMLTLESGESGDDLRIELLKDVKQIFDNTYSEKVSSTFLVEQLNSLTDRPWADFSHGKGLSTNKLANLLAPFGIEPKKLRIGTKTVRGYTLDMFKKVFSRYIPPEQTGTPEHCVNHAGLETEQNGTEKGHVPLSNRCKPASDKECSTVPLQKGENTEKKLTPLFDDKDMEVF